MMNLFKLLHSKVLIINHLHVSFFSTSTLLCMKLTLTFEIKYIFSVTSVFAISITNLREIAEQICNKLSICQKRKTETYQRQNCDKKALQMSAEKKAVEQPKLRQQYKNRSNSSNKKARQSENLQKKNKHFIVNLTIFNTLTHYCQIIEYANPW